MVWESLKDKGYFLGLSFRLEDRASWVMLNASEKRM